MTGCGASFALVPRPSTTYHHGDLRHALLAEAAKLVESEGTSALTLRELARRLGVSHAAPAHHFPDKAALLAELAAEGFEELARELEPAAAKGRSPGTRLREVGRAYVRFALRRPGHFRVMFGGALREASASERLASAGARAYAVLRDSVAAALPAGRTRTDERIDAASFFAWSVVHGAATLLLEGPYPASMRDAAGAEGAQELVDRATEVAASAIVAGY